jgi:hypothetical protein
LVSPRTTRGCGSDGNSSSGSPLLSSKNVVSEWSSRGMLFGAADVLLRTWSATAAPVRYRVVSRTPDNRVIRKADLCQTAPRSCSNAVRCGWRAWLVRVKAGASCIASCGVDCR